MIASEIKLGQTVGGGKVTSKIDNKDGTFEICFSCFDYEQREWEHFPMVFKENEEIDL